MLGLREIDVIFHNVSMQSTFAKPQGLQRLVAIGVAPFKNAHHRRA